MNETAITILNSVQDGASLVFDNVGKISATVVQETSNIGLAYIIAGLCMLFFGSLLVYVASQVNKKWTNSHIQGGWKSTVIIWICIASVTSFLLGTFIFLANLQNWLAPTREVAREVLMRLS